MGIRTGEFKRLYIADLSRYSEKLGKFSYIRRFLYLFRKCQTSKGLVFFFYRLLFKINQDKHGMEIPIETTIGKGLYLGHAYNITINGSATLGENVNLHKGVTIGQENRGNRKGAPTIGDDVWIGINATIVGNITIGNDVLIAPNTYVNCDVPNHSIVFGNPCVIKHRDNATEDYVNKGYSVLDIVKAFERVNDVKIPYVIDDRRPGDIATCYSDPSKAFRELGWKAE